MKQKQWLLGGFLLVVLLFLGGILYYTHVYTRTPVYSLQQVQQSWTKQDVLTFHKYVDVGAITKNYMSRDFAAEVESRSKELAPEAVDQYKEQMEIMKSLSEDVMQGVIDSYFFTGTYVAPLGVTNPLLDDFKTFLQKEKKLSVQSMKALDTEGDTSKVEVVYKDEETGTTKTVYLNMKRQKDGTWMVVDILNLEQQF